MAQPSPIFVTPSTTFVQVTTLQTPYTPVILNAYRYAGQVVSVLDGTSSFGILASSIVVSTAQTSQFTDGSISSVINQPQGFVTFQSQAPNSWAYLNSFPFYNQYVSAGVLNLTTSTLNVSFISSLQEFTSSLRVENLIVSGDFSQSSPFVINQSISSFGSVDLYSSFTTYGAAFFSSGLSTKGVVSLNSNLTIEGNLITPSSIQVLSTMYVSGSVLVVGNFSTPSIHLSGSLATYRLNVQESTIQSIDVAGSLEVHHILALSDAYFGGSLTSYRSQLGSLSTLSSMAIADSLAVTTSSIVSGTFSTTGSLILGGNLSTGTDTLVRGDIVGSSNLFLGGFLNVSTHLSTSDFQASEMWIQGNLQVNPGLSNSTSAKDITIGKSFGVGNLTATSTTIGGMLSTTNSAAIRGSFYGASSFQSVLEISTSQSLSTLAAVNVLGSLSTLNNVFVSGPVTIYQDLNVMSTSFWNQSNTSSSYIQGDLRILGNLVVTETLTLSSFVLPSSVVANNFEVSSLFVGFKGTASTTLISTLFASSIATGGLCNSQTTMDMANVLRTYNLSTFLLSTFEFEAKAEGATSISTFFQTLSSFGVGRTAQQGRFEVNPLAYSLCNTFAAKMISTNTMTGSDVRGLLFGDGTRLSNVQFPAQLSTGIVTTSTIIAGVVTATNTMTSTLTANAFFNYSSLTINTMNIFGNASNAAFISLNSNSIVAPYTPSNLLVVNPLRCYGDQIGIATKQVALTQFPFETAPIGTFALRVEETLRVNFISSPLFVLPLNEYRGDRVVTQRLGAISVQSLYVSSGLIGLSSGSFFLPENETYLTRSTSVIQPYFSTLMFNSTLFIKRENESVGINTFPTYALDVKGTAYAPSNVLNNTSSIIRDCLTNRQEQPAFWYAVQNTCNDQPVYFWKSYDGETWFTGEELFETGITLNSVSYDGGRISFTSDNLNTAQTMWVATGPVNRVYYKSGSNAWAAGEIEQTAKSEKLTATAFNGSYWVMSRLNPTNAAPLQPEATMMWSQDGMNWFNSVSGGFVADGGNTYYGSYGVAWSGSLWVAVGIGSSPLNSIVTSGDGSNWTNIALGGFTNGGYGVVYTGCNWVAVGNNGVGSSFLTSSNGLNWVSPGSYGFSNAGRAIAWNGFRLVAVGPYDTGYTSILYSDTYGQTWEAATGTLFDTEFGVGQCVTWNGSYWIAGGTTGIRKSYDGITWFEPSSPPSFVNGLGWSSNALPSFVVGLSTLKNFSTITTTTLDVVVGLPFGVNNATSVTSSNSKAWEQNTTGFFQNQGNAVAYNGSNLWVAVGNGGTSNSNIIYSGDGKTWLNMITSVNDMNVGNGVVYNNVPAGTLSPDGCNVIPRNWISVHTSPYGGAVAQFYSSDGCNWNPSSGTQFDVAGYGVAVDSNIGEVVAVGNSASSGPLLYSVNDGGQIWDYQGVTGMFDTDGRGIAFGGGRYVAVGTDSGGNTIKYTGTGSLKYRIWNNATGSLFTTRGLGVAYDGVGKWVAVGDSGGSGGTIKYSTDGQAWSAAASGEFDSVGYAVAYNQGSKLWIAVGIDTSANIKYSGDGINWSNGTGDGASIIQYGVATSFTTSISLQPYREQVRLIKNPGFQVMAREATPYIAYTSTFLDVNNVISFDSNQNIVIRPSTLGLFTSTFYEMGQAIVSGYVSTQRMALNGGFYLGIQEV